jgi:hypothetical protein
VCEELPKRGRNGDDWHGLRHGNTDWGAPWNGAIVRLFRRLGLLLSRSRWWCSLDLLVRQDVRLGKASELRQLLKSGGTLVMPDA